MSGNVQSPFMNTSSTSTLLIVTGYPAAGKTTIAREVARTLEWPLVTKDGVKERLFDTLGWDDREWSSRLSKAAFAVLLHVARPLARSRTSAVLEANFKTDIHDDALADIHHETDVELLQLYLTARPDVVEERLRRRARRNPRHPGHRDDALRTDIPRQIERGVYGPLDLPGRMIRADTSNQETQTIIRQVLRRIHR